MDPLLPASRQAIHGFTFSRSFGPEQFNPIEAPRRSALSPFFLLRKPTVLAVSPLVVEQRANWSDRVMYAMAGAFLGAAIVLHLL